MNLQIVHLLCVLMLGFEQITPSMGDQRIRVFESNESTKCMERELKSGCNGLSSGIQNIKIPGLDSFEARCYAEIESGGWIVVHIRFDGNEDFNRTWTDFCNGFGKLDDEFFIGLKQLHRITNTKRYELRIQIGDYDGNVQFASYDNFRIGNESEKYALMSLGEFSGTTHNSMEHNLYGEFSTFDHDNDRMNEINCALDCGAWWHKYGCYGPKLNGKYFKTAVFQEGSMNWNGFFSLKTVEMLIRIKS